MGLMDEMAGKVLGNMLGGGGSSGGSNPMVACLLQMINNHPGGLSGLVQAFQEKGLGEIASSWVGSGQNLPVSADQIHQVLGSPMVQQFAARCGLNPQEAGSKLAEVLPMIVDHLTPQGKVA
jgi:uncharacterized protein YidB (DUF937 family)